MKLFSTAILTCLVAILSTGCVSSDRLELRGIPRWIAGGAKLDGEPEPYRPDPAIAHYDEEGGPVKLRYTLDKREYPEPKPKKVEKPSTHDPLERGRHNRIKRLVR